MIRPFLGIIFLVNLLILIFNKIGLLPRKLALVMRRRYLFLSIIVVAFILSSIVYMLIGIITLAAVDNSSNFYHLSSLLPCQTPAQAQVEPGFRVVVRIDDIQAQAMTETTLAMLDEAYQRQIPLVLGVIPKDLDKDQRLVSMLKRYQCNLEIALHGWYNSVNGNYELAEFGNLDFTEAKQRIERGRQVLQKLLGVDLVTFIPPNNHYSYETALALARVGVPVVSSEGNAYFDYNASTFDFDKDELEPVEHVIKDCYRGYQERGLCVIMLHPQDFMTNNKHDEAKFSNYIYLLDGLQKLNAQFVTFSDLIVLNPELSYLYIKDLYKDNLDKTAQ